MEMPWSGSNHGGWKSMQRFRTETTKMSLQGIIWTPPIIYSSIMEWATAKTIRKELKREKLIKNSGGMLEEMLNAKCPQGVRVPGSIIHQPSAPTLTASPRHQGLLSGESPIFIKWMQQCLGKLAETGSTMITPNLHSGASHRPVEGVCCEIKQLPLKRRL